ncbi:G-protein coupled receptor GRL101-like protein [Trichoplax sp. H2]|nr:G-protein coupled receptor GRL101-like protein [Trichoplax sp. H2]|eukprot:RDD37320.1 G-protein coupled receptor GRL101-like protein [Trichoplax sp. H2]
MLELKEDAVLSGNHITNLTRGSISCLKTLSTLYLRKNDIEDIEARAFCGATNLQALILSQNLIKEIAPSAFCDMPSLSLLNLSHNAIQDIENNSFCETMSLTALDLTGNLLTKITNKTFACLGKLFKLQLSYNNMQDIAPRSFCTLLKLKRLYLDQNKLQNISESMLSCLKKLLTLNLNLNEINNIMVGAFEDLVILQELSLESNQISTISPFAFTKLAKLATLKLAGNHLSRFNGLIFSANVTLSVLGLEKTNIRRLSGPDIFNGNQTLAELDLSYNQISENPNLQFYDCKTLKITHNYLQESPPLNFNGVPSLESLHLGWNRYHTIDANFFVTLNHPIKMQELFLRNNRLNSVHDLTMANLKNLRKLDLRGNHLKDLTFLQPLISLSFLNLAGNDIQVLDLKNFRNLSLLTELYLGNNKIQYLEENYFANTRLNTLYLDNNRIRSVKSTFDGISSLTNLSLEGNHIDSWNALRFNNTKLISLNIRNNRLSAIGNMKHTKIKNLDIGNNIISNLSCEGLSPLSVFIFDNNNISHIESNCQLIFERLSHINASYNNLIKNGVDIGKKLLNHLHTIYEINIAGNNVKKLSTDIDPYFFRSLDISDNPIRLQNIKGILRRRTVIYITALDISNNNLGSIDIANLAADSYKNLEALDIRNNEIIVIHNRCFRGLLRIKFLYVQGNSLAFVTQTSFFGPPDLSTVLSGRDYLCCMVPGKVKTCQPSMFADTLSSCSYLLAHASLDAFVWIVGSLALIGNIIVLLQNHYSKSIKSNLVPTFLISNLAISDLIMSIYLLTIGIANLIYSDGDFGLHSENWLSNPGCHIACLLVIISTLMSVLIMAIISVDRFICIAYPFSTANLSLKVARITLGLVWLIIISFSSIPVMFSINQPGHLRIYAYNSMCMPNNYRGIFNATWMISYLSITVIVWIIMIALYTRIFMAVQQSSKGIRKSSLNDNKILAIRLSLILISDLISWLPYLYITISGLILEGKVDTITLQFIATFTLPLNSAINPFLYTLTSIKVLKRTFLSKKTKPSKSAFSSQAVTKSSVLSMQLVTFVNTVED